MVETRQIAELPPEVDFLAVSAVAGDMSNVRDRVSRWMKSGEIQGVVPGIYVTAPEFRKRPVSVEILANKIMGPSYVSFEYVLARAGLIPEAVQGITSATPKRNRDFNTPLGHFSYRHLPLEVYCFGWTQETLTDGSGFLIATPEKALLDMLYRSGAVRSIKALEARLFEDFRLDADAFHTLDVHRLLEYVLRMPGNSFGIHFSKLLGRFYE
ncbi:hypothetical protein LWX53_07660 [bacterium]|nr:hypothetical protein [bacterium]